MPNVVLNGATGKTVVVNRDRNTATVQQGGAIVHVQDHQLASQVDNQQRTIEVSSPGARGPQGFQGADGAMPTRTVTNGENFALVAGMPVCLVGGIARRANTSTGRHEVIGFVTTGIPIGGSGLIQMAGLLSQPTAEWDAVSTYLNGLVVGSPYYLWGDGRLSPVPPDPATALGEWLVRIGVAITTTDLFIDIEPGTKL